MNGNSGMKKGKIIFGILNWGLGHATRCVPLIKAAEQAGFDPVLASDGAALDFLKTQFPHCKTEELPAYDIHYQSSGKLLWTMLGQMPKVLSVSRKEQKKLADLVEKHSPVGVVSDNRPGFYNPKVPSVYMTHQLKIMLPAMRHFFSKAHHRYINWFDECWVPDFENEPFLTGEMGHDLKPEIPLKFIGPMSRFSRPIDFSKKKKYRACALLSGPEPQRTFLEEKLLSEMGKMEGHFMIIRGLKNPEEEVEKNSNVDIKNFAESDEILEIFSQSEIIISRSGYSSIMDYFFLKNKALLIPTLGQPEQEYLARWCLKNGWFGYAAQEFLDLEKDLAEAGRHGGFQSVENEKGERLENLFGLFKE